MTSVVDLGIDELRERRSALLGRVGMSWMRLSELAEAYSLDADERNIYETIRSIDYLLTDDDGQ